MAFITPARVRALRDASARPREAGGIGHSAAFNLLKTGRQVFAFAENIDMIAKGSNPFGKFQFGAPPARKLIWEADDEAAFKAAAIDLGYPSMSLALELAIYTAQREGDLGLHQLGVPRVALDALGEEKAGAVAPSAATSTGAV